MSKTRVIAFICCGLVVAALLLGFLAVAVFRLRQTSYEQECKNNLRQIGLAATMYLDEHKAYPPGTIRNADLRPDQRLSWQASLLPYFIEMEVQRRKTSRETTSYYEVFAGIDKKKAWDDPANRDATARMLRCFICPAHPPFTEEPVPGPTYYVGIAGFGANAAELPSSDRNCGFFGYDRTITPGDITRGLSETMMASETSRHNGPWAQGGEATVRGLDPDDLPYSGRGRPLGGLHPGITMILHVDASVQAFRDTGSADVFANKVTLKSGLDEPPKH